MDTKLLHENWRCGSHGILPASRDTRFAETNYAPKKVLDVFLFCFIVVDSPDFMFGGCTHIAVMLSAHTNHMSKVQCAEERQKLATESTSTYRKIANM